MMSRIGVAALLVAAGMTGPAWALQYWVDAGDGPVAQHLAREAGHYLNVLFTDSATAADDFAASDIALLTLPASPDLAVLVDQGAIDLPDGPHAAQGYGVKTIDGRIIVAGLTDAGVLYGLYDLLEAYGCYFQISGERLPEPAPFIVRGIDIRREPVFAYRGLLPWDNFLCGMSGYNLEDYKLLLRRAARMKFNMLQFHFYPEMAFFTETAHGETATAKRVGSPIDVFETVGAVGEAAFGGEARFAPAPYLEHMGDPAAQARACQAMLRDVLAYAGDLGFTTVTGFELMRSPVGPASLTDKPAGSVNALNPLDHANVELALQRYHSLVRTYPESDYYWLWQSEGRGILGRPVGREPGAAEMRERRAHWAGNPDLAGDIDYAYLFNEVVKRLSPAERARTSTGGWTIEHIFPGFHRDAPPQVTFASLNIYDPTIALDNMRFYETAATGRPTWMIEWWEFDGEQWFPQWRAGWQERMYRLAMESGVDGVSLLGWKLSGVEHNVRYLADFAWEPGTAEAFYKDYVTRLYGDSAAPLVERFLAYDAIAPEIPPATAGDDRRMLLAAGWMALPIPPMPTTAAGLDEATWHHAVERAEAIAGEQRDLRHLDTETLRLIEQIMPDLDETGREWAGLLANRLAFRVTYLDSLIELNSAYPLYDRVARLDGLEAAARAAAGVMGKALELARDATHLYAREVRNRNDLGVVAQLNAQYIDSIEHVLSNLGGTASPYVTIDWGALRVVPEIAFDFTDGTAWTYRDGNATVHTTTQNGQPALLLEVGGDGVTYSSVMVHDGVLDLETAPILDFEVRVESAAAPLSFLLQLGDDPTWQAFDLVGRQSRYPQLDAVPRGALDDGRWHRVTWDMARAVRERLDPDRKTVGPIVFGSWEASEKPSRIAFRNVTLGRRRTLD